MNNQLALFVLLSFIVLVPIVPAYLLFKALPARADVTGTLQGMEIKLGGAFAGYFALVLLIIVELPRMEGVVNPSSSQVWDVEGQVLDDQGNGIEPLDPADVRFQPTIFALDQHGRFKATFATTLSRTGAEIIFPSVFLNHKGFEEMPLDLGRPKAEKEVGNQDIRDETNHYIKLKSVKLKKLKSYSGDGPPPPQGNASNYRAPAEKPPQGGPPQ